MFGIGQAILNHVTSRANQHVLIHQNNNIVEITALLLIICITNYHNAFKGIEVNDSRPRIIIKKKFIYLKNTFICNIATLPLFNFLQPGIDLTISHKSVLLKRQLKKHLPFLQHGSAEAKGKAWWWFHFSLPCTQLRGFFFKIIHYSFKNILKST